ncbi:MAG: hypothetical protein JXP39_06940, partial [Spirochaetales bacterium]|nr:hypothetical protein [Spirochaetales bacterium]
MKKTFSWITVLIAIITLASCTNPVSEPDQVSILKKDIVSFSFSSEANANLSDNIVGTISGTEITVTVPYNTDVTALVATFTVSPEASAKVNGTAQASGKTLNDFTNPVSYAVVATDGSIKNYIVIVVTAPNTANDITSFTFTAEANAVLSTDVTATISG